MIHNDYVIAVREYLRRYTEFTTYMDNLRADISDLESQLSLLPAPRVSSLSPAPGRCGEEITPAEREYMKREAMQERLTTLQQELAELEPLINRLNRSLDALEYAEHEIILRRMIHGESWLIIAGDLNISESMCRRKGKYAVEKVAGMMFGPRAIPVQMHFTFFE